MTGRNSTWINEPQSPVHSGTGPQFNVTYHTLGASDRPNGSGSDPLRVAENHRNDLSRRFVPPRDFGRAVERLAAPGTMVLLDGPRGSGRRTAAIMLLHRLGEPQGRFEELAAEDEDGRLEAAPGDRFFLDLSAVDDDVYRDVQRRLASYRAEVEEGDARLAVVLPAGLDSLLDPQFAPLRVSLGRPRGLTVLRQHLRQDDIPHELKQLAGTELRQLLDRSPMREVARLAEMVRRARDSGHYGTDFSSWCAEAMAAVTDWAGDAARQVADHRTVRERALLLTTAVFSGATADAVFHGTQRLLAQLRHEEEEIPRLARPGLGQQLKDLQIRRDQEGRVRFERLAYDTAVRAHFWTNFPDLRNNLRDWVKDAIRLPDLTADDRRHIAVRFAEQALASGRHDDLVQLVETWTRPDGPGPLRAEAKAVLRQGLGHERYGARFRKRVREWASGTNLSPDLADVLTEVCRQDIAATHPDQAVVRLRHLALRRVTGARAALLDLARGSSRLYRQLLDQLLERLRSRTGTDLKSQAAVLLVDLLGPPGPRTPTLWDDLILAWHTVIKERAPDDWTPAVHLWLTAVRDDARWSPVLEVLPAAAAGRREALHRFYATACDWGQEHSWDPVESSARETVAEKFWHTIDRAQAAVLPDDRPDAPNPGEPQ
ncbi:hypothetical protein ACFU7T_03940 [Streptomyces sp. NPDC057555]|uniref:hypothetical protein n=1 Tax=Streptomyces sp. NPDC057555 TaxID=3346166 RepID=UPI0036CE6C66